MRVLCLDLEPTGIPQQVRVPCCTWCGGGGHSTSFCVLDQRGTACSSTRASAQTLSFFFVCVRACVNAVSSAVACCCCLGESGLGLKKCCGRYIFLWRPEGRVFEFLIVKHEKKATTGNISVLNEESARAYSTHLLLFVSVRICLWGLHRCPCRIFFIFRPCARTTRWLGRLIPCNRSLHRPAPRRWNFRSKERTMWYVYGDQEAEAGTVLRDVSLGMLGQVSDG